MEAGDWVVIYKQRFHAASGKWVEAMSKTVRVEKRTPKQVKVAGEYRRFSQIRDDLWQTPEDYDGDRRYLRPATPEEVQQGEEAERKQAEAAQKYKEAAEKMRLVLANIEWGEINDMTVNDTYKMVFDERNRR